MRSHRMRGLAGNSVIPQDYIAYWDMAGNALDETGNYDISLFNGPVQNADHVNFDGFDDRGECARLAFNNNAFIIVSRFRLDSLDTANGDWLINSRSAASGSENEWQILVDSSGTLRFGISNTSAASFTADGPAITTGTWYTFAFRFTGSAIEIHEASGLFDSVATSGNINTGALVTTWAKRGWSSVWANVDISRTIAYDYALSPGDIPSVIDLIENGA